MRRWAKRVGLGVLCVLGVLAGLGWYVWTLPWRNACDEPLPPAPTLATNA